MKIMTVRMNIACYWYVNNNSFSFAIKWNMDAKHIWVEAIKFPKNDLTL